MKNTTGKFADEREKRVGGDRIRSRIVDFRPGDHGSPARSRFRIDRAVRMRGVFVSWALRIIAVANWLSSGSFVRNRDRLSFVALIATQPRKTLRRALS